MSGELYRLLHTPMSLVFKVAVRQWICGRERLPNDGPVILVVSHLSHSDPIPLAVATPRHIAWMAREEAFRGRVSARFMDLFGAFSIDRFGFALPGLREALRRLDQGQVVGIFPEGEVHSGEMSVLKGGPIKYGAAWLARRANVPIVPCVALGSRTMNTPIGWMPLKQGRSWVAFGDPIHPNHEVAESRAGREALGQEVGAALRKIYAELLDVFTVPDKYGDV